MPAARPYLYCLRRHGNVTADNAGAKYDTTVIAETFGEENVALVSELCDYLYAIREKNVPDIERIVKDTKPLEYKDMGSGRTIYVLTYENGIQMIIPDGETAVTIAKAGATMEVDLGFLLIPATVQEIEQYDTV